MIELSEKCQKIFKTCALYLCFIILGMVAALFGPCLLDLRDLVNTDMQHIGVIYTARSIAFLIGSILGGILLDKTKYKQAVMTFCNFTCGIFTLAIPWSTNYVMLIGFTAAMCVGHGTIQIGVNVLCLTIWGSESGPFLHALHFVFGVGGLISPLIAAPFLADQSSYDSLKDTSNTSHSTNYTSALNFTPGYSLTANSSSNDSFKRVVYPFSIIGFLSILVSLLFLVICIISPTEKVDNQQPEKKEDSKYNLSFISSTLVLNSLLIFVESGTEIGYAQLLTTYVVKGDVNLSASIGSYMTSAFWAAFTAARLAAIFIAIKNSHFSMILGNLITISIGALIFLFLSSHEWAMWIVSILLGAGIASFFPASIGWLDTYVPVTNKMTSAFAVGGAVGDILIPFTIAYFIEEIPDVLIYVVLATCILCSLIVLILYLILRRKPKRTKKVEPTSSVVSDTAM